MIRIARGGATLAGSSVGGPESERAMRPRPSWCVENWRATVPAQNSERVNQSDVAEHLDPRQRAYRTSPEPGTTHTTWG